MIQLCITTVMYDTALHHYGDDREDENHFVFNFPARPDYKKNTSMYIFVSNNLRTFTPSFTVDI